MKTVVISLLGTMLDNRAIRVNEAQARPDRSAGGGSRLVLITVASGGKAGQRA